MMYIHVVVLRYGGQQPVHVLSLGFCELQEWKSE